MANLTETPQWEAGITRTELDSIWKGGEGGFANQATTQLANRTAYLKQQVESVGSGKQDTDPTLNALAALAGIADRLPYFAGNDVAALTAFTAFARTLVAATDAAAVRALLNAVTQADINTAVANLVDSSPAALNTLKELADAMGDDPNFATTVNAAIAARITQVQGDARYVLLSAIASYAQLTVSQSWTKGQRGAELALPATTGTVTLDLAQSNNHGGALTGNIVLANPSSMPVGQSGVIRLLNAGPYTISYGSYWKPADGASLPALTATVGANDDLPYYVETSTRILIGRVGGST